MEHVKYKIVGYDNTSHSLLVCFSSDTTNSTNPEDYPVVAINPAQMWPDITDMEEIKAKIAEIGLSIVAQQVAKETFNRNPVKQIEFEKLVGATHQYALADLIVDPVHPTIVDPLNVDNYEVTEI